MPIERPTFHESWYRVATLRPQLRSTVQTWRQHFRGRRWHVVRDAASNQHFRLDDAGYHLVGLLDGRRTVEDAWRLAQERFGDRAPTQGEVIQVLGQLHASNLLRSDLPADAAGMFEAHGRRRRREVGGYLMNLLFMRIPLFDPDHLLERWERVAGGLFSLAGVAVWTALVLTGTVIALSRAGDLLAGASGVLAPENLFLLYLCFAVIKALHELGHGFATRRLGRLTGSGGEVHVMGIMLLVFTPIPYVDASSAWAFRSKWHRAAVGAAGMYVELAIAAVAVMVWANTSPGTVNAIAYNTIFIASVSTILFNANPLLRFDGYYILSDLLEIPNLSRRSRDHLVHLVKRHVFGVQRTHTPVRSSGERFWLPVYAVASAIYRVVIFTGIILFVADKLFFIGALFAISGIAAWVIVPTVRLVRYLATSPELARVRPRAVLASAAFVAAIVIVIGGVPWPDRARAQGVIEPVDAAIIHVEEDGFVREVRPSGGAVEGDAPLLRAENPVLRAERARLEAQRRIAVIRRERARLEEVAIAQSFDDRVAALDEQLARIDQRLAALELRAPAAGRWIAPDAASYAGAYLRRGQRVGLVADIDRLLLRAVCDQRLGPRLPGEVGAGADVEVRVHGRPDVAFTATLREFLPAGSTRLPSAALGYRAGGATRVALDDGSGTSAAEPVFEVHLDPPGASIDDVALFSGQRVELRFTMPSRPLAVQWWRSLRQLVQRRFQI